MANLAAVLQVKRRPFNCQHWSLLRRLENWAVFFASSDLLSNKGLWSCFVSFFFFHFLIKTKWQSSSWQGGQGQVKIHLHLCRERRSWGSFLSAGVSQTHREQQDWARRCHSVVKCSHHRKEIVWENDPGWPGVRLNRRFPLNAPSLCKLFFHCGIPTHSGTNCDEEVWQLWESAKLAFDLSLWSPVLQLNFS